MGLILCRQEPVKHPFYIERLGIHIYSSQELCYVIYNNPLLVLEDFIDEALLTFIREELDMEFLAARLEKWRRSGENNDEQLLIILQECDYYTAIEINRFRQHILMIRKMHPADFEKAKADYIFQQKQYGKAILAYEKILEFPKDHFVNDIFMGKIWNNLGTAYARMFQPEKAYQAFDKAYLLTKDQAVLQRIYYLSIMNPELSQKERYQSLMTEELKRVWDVELEKAKDKAQTAESIVELNKLFQRDSIKRMAGATELVSRWKQEYRTML